MIGPVDRRLVQSILKADLKGAVAQYGEAWFLSVCSCWPACSEHGDYIDAIEARAATAHLGSPCETTQALPGKSDVVEIPKVAVFEVGDDAVAWLEQVESVCTLARFAKPAWCALAAASMAETPLKCWVAHKRQFSELDCDSELWHWDSFKDWGSSSLNIRAIMCCELSELKQTTTVAAYKADFDRLAAKADLSEQETVSYWISGLKANVQAERIVQSSVGSLTCCQAAASAAEAQLAKGHTENVAVKSVTSGKRKWRRAGKAVVCKGKKAKKCKPKAKGPKRKRKARKNKCFRCKQLGHIARDCPEAADDVAVAIKIQSPLAMNEVQSTPECIVCSSASLPTCPAYLAQLSVQHCSVLT